MKPITGLFAEEQSFGCVPPGTETIPSNRSAGGSALSVALGESGSCRSWRLCLGSTARSRRALLSASVLTVLCTSALALTAPAALAVSTPDVADPAAAATDPAPPVDTTAASAADPSTVDPPAPPVASDP